MKQIVPPSPAKSDADYHNDSNNDAHFEPVIDLPPEVEVVTGMFLNLIIALSCGYTENWPCDKASADRYIAL